LPTDCIGFDESSEDNIVAGDGYFYTAYQCQEQLGGGFQLVNVTLTRVNSNGASDNIPVTQFVQFNVDDTEGLTTNMITNADTGVVLTWLSGDGLNQGIAITNGTSVTVNGPIIPGQDVQPVLQAQDGSFFGVVYPEFATSPSSIAAFDQSGNVRWIVPNDQPQIATADGGVTGQSGTTYDANGNATGQLANLVTQSWRGGAYEVGLVLNQVMAKLIDLAVSYAAASGGTPSKSGTDAHSYTAPEEALAILASTDLTATPQCNALLGQFANEAKIPKPTLIAQLQVAANGARNFVYDGPSSNVPLDPVNFPGQASTGVATAGQWFASHSTHNDYADGFSQFTGAPIFVRLDDWHRWVLGPVGLGFGKMLFPFTAKVTYYGLGTVMHEILHKQSVGGGFTHTTPPGPRDYDRAIDAVGRPAPTVSHNEISDAIGKLCFPNLIPNFLGF
jgi:hypothetical protein